MMKAGMRCIQKTKSEQILPSASIQCLGCLGRVIESDGRAAQAQVAGSLAQKKARAGAQLQGVLVQQGGRHTVVAAQDLPVFTSLHPGRILQRQILALRKPFSEVTAVPLLLL